MEDLLESRKKSVRFAEQKLLQNSFPRVQVSIILFITALTGFLVSFSLLHSGVSSMTLRYPISIAVAYCVFLILLRLWLWMQNPYSIPDGNLPDLDLDDLADVSVDIISDAGLNFNIGDAGESVSSTAGGGSFFDSLSFDLDELGWIILAVVAIVGGLLASLYIIYIAPILLAEILVDGILITGLYNRVKKIERRYWLETAVKKTLLPAVLAALFFSLTGFAMQKIAPQASSIGETFNYISGSK